MVTQSRLDEVKEWLGPLRRPRPRRVLRGDDDRAAQATVRTSHPLAQKRDRVRPRLGERLSKEGRGGLADSPIVVARESVTDARELAEVSTGKGPDEEPGELLVDAPGMRQKALRPIQPHAWGRIDRIDHLDRAVVLILAHPPVQTRLAERVGRAERVSGSQRALESLEPGGRGRSCFGCRHARPTKRAIRSPASSIFSRLVA